MGGLKLTASTEEDIDLEALGSKRRELGTHVLGNLNETLSVT